VSYSYCSVSSMRHLLTVSISVADPDPPGPGVFGPPGSGSVSQRYGSGLLVDFLPLKNDVIVPSKSIMQKNFFFKFVFCWHLKVNDENRRIRIH
jgi:hypothetical protein